MIRIRPAKPADVPALAALAQRTWSDAFGWSISPEELAAELENRSEASFADALETWTTLVADDDGSIVGYVQFGDVALTSLYAAAPPSTAMPTDDARLGQIAITAEKPAK